MIKTAVLNITIKAYSSVSEASLHRHLESILKEIVDRTENVKYQEWHNKIYTSYDESHPVDFDIEYEKTIE